MNPTEAQLQALEIDWKEYYTVLRIVKTNCHTFCVMVSFWKEKVMIRMGVIYPQEHHLQVCYSVFTLSVVNEI